MFLKSINRFKYLWRYVFISLILISQASLSSYPQDQHFNQFNFQSPISSQSSSTQASMIKVAIIGAGAAGSSAAFFLSHLANLSSESISIDLFEKSSYIGGRSNVIYPFDSEIFEPIEAGASIFVDANLHLHKAIKTFDLKLKSFQDDDGGKMGIWDGTEFAFQQSGQHWLDMAKMFWRYGRAPLQLETEKEETLNQFKSIYQAEFASRGPIYNLSSWLEASQLANLLPITGTQKLIDQQAINVQAVNELAAAACRVNYGQDISDIHALATMVSLAGSNGASVVGGNRQIFEGFASESRATVHLAHEVTQILQTHNTSLDSQRTQYRLSYRDLQGSPHPIVSQAFDAVIIAAPFHQTGIDVPDLKPTSSIPLQAYVHLHVTFVVTNASSPSGKAFGLPAQDELPKTIYSTMMRNVLGKGQRPIFNSLAYLQNLGPKDNVIGDLHVVKLFSEAALSIETLAEVFNATENLIWIKRLEWDAYPVLSPISDPNQLAPIKLDDGLFYVNGFERLVSTMETETVAAWNIANMITQDFWNFRASRAWTDE